MAATSIVDQTGSKPAPQSSATMRLWAEAWSYPQFRAGLFLFVLLLIVAIFWPLFSPYSATKIVVMDKFRPPAFLAGGRWDHPLGTDQLGRDLFVRSLVGLQNALMISVVTVVLMFLIGSIVGILSGYFGRWVDVVLMRITDAQLSIPLIILAITILTVSRPTSASVTLVLALSGWPVYARVTRSVTLSERRREYVRGAKILGASDLRVMILMIAPNILPGRLRRCARHRTDDDIRGDPRLHRHRYPAADADLRHDHLGRKEVFDQRLVDCHDARHLPVHNAVQRQPHGCLARAGTQPSL